MTSACIALHDHGEAASVAWRCGQTTVPCACIRQWLEPCQQPSNHLLPS